MQQQVDRRVGYAVQYQGYALSTRVPGRPRDRLIRPAASVCGPPLLIWPPQLSCYTDPATPALIIAPDTRIPRLCAGREASRILIRQLLCHDDVDLRKYSIQPWKYIDSWESIVSVELCLYVDVIFQIYKLNNWFYNNIIIKVMG